MYQSQQAYGLRTMSKIDNELEKKMDRTTSVARFALDTATVTSLPVTSLYSTLRKAVKEHDVAEMR